MTWERSARPSATTRPLLVAPHGRGRVHPVHPRSRRKERMPELFIDGSWRDAGDGRTREIRCPADGSVVATVSEAGPEDALDAVRAARRAFDEGPWRDTPAPERAAILHRVANRLEADKDEVARLESLDTGKRLVESEIDVDDIVSV